MVSASRGMCMAAGKALGRREREGPAAGAWRGNERWLLSLPTWESHGLCRKRESGRQRLMLTKEAPVLC